MKNFSISKRSEGFLTPVTLCGVVVPWTKSLGDGRLSDYKLTCVRGVEYFIVADSEWRQVLSRYCWEEVTVKGLLNVSNMTLVPQKVFPRGPTGERNNVIDIAAWKGRDLVKRLTKSVADLILVPTAVLAVMS